jgi:hypothetical protein
MRTSLNEIKLIDDYLFNKIPQGDKLVFDARLILNPDLADGLLWQKQTHAIITRYSRKKLKAEIDNVHNQLFKNPEHKSFRQRILNLF